MIDQEITPSNLASRRTKEQKREDDERATVWTFVWTLFGFKIATLGVIMWLAAGSAEASLVVVATNWFWLLIPAFAIAGPLLFHFRLRKARRRRASLMREEWMLK